MPCAPSVLPSPPLGIDYLARGHAIHFRCRHPDAEGIRIDVMSVLRGVDDFETLWARRTTVELTAESSVDVLSVQDLVQAKKTQSDKDWPMLRRLVEAHYEANRERSTAEQVRFWLEEARTPELLIELAKAHPADADSATTARPLLAAAVRGDEEALRSALREEEERIRAVDRTYWAPLREELERLRHRRENG